ncbi:MAG TPA: SAV_2336 N-terminal domain-related protein, partial [Caldilineaceae bacterium]|nr:SAV_2336 N-terminal domain-related protein [Caldilineaceae bacterium]
MREFIEYLLPPGGHAANHINAEEIADILWLAAQLPPPTDEGARRSEGRRTDTGRDRQARDAGPERQPDDSGAQPPPPQPTDEKRADAFLPGSQREDGTGPGIASLPFSSPRVTALPQRLALGRALRTLKRTAPSPTRFVLDEDATVQRIADERNWLPVMRPARERWLELVLLADESPSMTVWYALVGELQDLLEQSGAFRTVQRWGFYADPEQAAALRFYAGSRFWEGTARYRSPAELNDPRGRRLILLVSDCVSAAWRQPGLNGFLADWKGTPATLVQVLPERLWGRTGLRLGREAA